jgi:hypothetical protein
VITRYIGGLIEMINARQGQTGIDLMIEELERRARLFTNGDAKDRS